MKIEFTVYGLPQPAGSKRAFVMQKAGQKPRAIVTDANPSSRDWKNAVASTAISKRNGHSLLTGPLSFVARFYRPRPSGHYGKQGLNKKGRETPFPCSKPDVLKLARGTEDALTGIVWRDDSQIVDERISKFWGEPARCEIEILEVEAMSEHSVELPTAAGLYDARYSATDHRAVIEFAPPNRWRFFGGPTWREVSELAGWEISREPIQAGSTRSCG